MTTITIKTRKVKNNNIQLLFNGKVMATRLQKGYKELVTMASELERKARVKHNRAVGEGKVVIVNMVG